MYRADEVSVHRACYIVNFRKLNDHLFGKELFILFDASAFCKLSSIYVFSYFPFGFEGRIWDLIVSVPDHCLSFYFPNPTHLEDQDQDSLLVKRRNDNQSPGPVIRELVPGSHQRSELSSTILCIFSG